MKSFIINSKKHGNFKVLVDDEDFERVSKHGWSINKKTDNYYVAETRISKKKCIRLHRFILNITNPKIEIDHIDRNPMNNQKNNLRIASRNSNMRNCKSNGNKTGYRGVFKNNKKYSACISVNNKTIHLGTYNTAEEAAIVRDKKALEVSGEFAILNFPNIPKEW